MDELTLRISLHAACVELLTDPLCTGPDSEPFKEYLRVCVQLRELEGVTLQ